MTKEFFKKLKPDLSNIETVYDELLDRYNPDNIERTELMFINSFEFDNIDFTGFNEAGFSEFYQKKITTVEWHKIDIYNRYLKNRVFGLNLISYLCSKGDKNFRQTHLELQRKFEEFEFIYNRLDDIDKIELKYKFLDSLNFHEARIHKSEFKILFKNLIQRVESVEIPELTPEPDNKKPDEVKKELHPEIFKGNSFEIWQLMFEKFDITESSYSTDVDFMFEVMKYNKQIHNHIRLTDMRTWINTVYEITFEKLRYTNTQSGANKKRLVIYNNIISNKNKGTKHT